MKPKGVLGLWIAALLIILPVTGCSRPRPRVTDAYPDKKVGFQLEKPEKGEQIAVMHTSMGDVKMRFFEKAAPKAVENFITHAKNGYYDGITLHRVIDGFMIQGGDPTGTGSGGESIWAEPFEDE